MERRILRPVARVARSARDMAAGAAPESVHPVRVDGPAEIRDLSDAVHDLGARLREELEGLAAERHRVNAVLTGMADGMVIVDRQLRVQRINEAAGRLLHVSSEAATGQTLAAVVRDHELVGRAPGGPDGWAPRRSGRAPGRTGRRAGEQRAGGAPLRARHRPPHHRRGARRRPRRPADPAGRDRGAPHRGHQAGVRGQRLARAAHAPGLAQGPGGDPGRGGPGGPPGGAGVPGPDARGGGQPGPDGAGAARPLQDRVRAGQPAPGAGVRPGPGGGGRGPPADAGRAGRGAPDPGCPAGPARGCGPIRRGWCRC